MGKKILVVDNHPVMLKFMTQLLEKEGHQVLAAENGLSALDVLMTETPDVIFSPILPTCSRNPTGKGSGITRSPSVSSSCHRAFKPF